MQTCLTDTYQTMHYTSNLFFFTRYFIKDLSYHDEYRCNFREFAHDPYRYYRLPEHYTRAKLRKDHRPLSLAASESFPCDVHFHRRH